MRGQSITLRILIIFLDVTGILSILNKGLVKLYKFLLIVTQQSFFKSMTYSAIFLNMKLYGKL